MRKFTVGVGFLLAVVMLGTVVLSLGISKVSAAKQDDGSKKVKVGLVFDVGGRGDKSFNDAAYVGLKKAQQELGDKIDVKFLDLAGSGENREALLRKLTQEKCDIIFGVGFMFTDAITNVAKDFPQTKFALIDGFIPDLQPESNVSCLVFKEEEGSFLVGAAAALKSKTGKIGFVGGMQTPFIEKFETGYIAGAKYVNPGIALLSDYIGTTEAAFKDSVKGQELTLEQIKNGADVIYHAAGASGAGVIEAVAAENKLAIGVDSDQSLTATKEQRPFILTSMVKKIDVAVIESIKSVVNGSFKGGLLEFGVRDGGVSYAENEYNKGLIADSKGQLEEIKAKIISGKIKVPTSKKDLR